jgi:hypothetical protein
MSNDAADQILAGQKGMNGSPFENGGTRDQLRAYLSEHPDGDGLTPVGGVTGQFILAAMAGAKEPSDVLVALQNSGLGSSTGVAEFLMNFYYGTLRARKTLGNGDKGSPLPGGYANRPQGC